MGAYRAALAALLVLAACGGNPFVAETTDPTVPVDPDTGEEIAEATGNGVLVYDETRANVNSVEYATAANGPIKLNMSAEDAANLNQSYARNTALDVAGYKAYTHQETGSNRMVVALVSDTLGSARAVVAVDAGQFANSHGGGMYSRAEAFTKPADPSGAQAKFNYSGSYVGLVNFGPNTPGGPGGSLNPRQAYRTTGEVLVTADFEDMLISGGIDNRRIVETGERLADQMMVEGVIDANGNFTGGMKREDVDPTTGVPSQTESGSYSGIFAGANGSEIAALYVFKPYKDGEDDLERGIFVSGNCVIKGGPNCRP